MGVSRMDQRDCIVPSTTLSRPVPVPERRGFGTSIEQLEYFSHESAFGNSVENAINVDSIYADYLTATLNRQM